MSWLSKTSSNLLKIPAEVLQDIQDITDEIINYTKAKKTKSEAIGTISFLNPYTNKQQATKIVIFPENYKHYNEIAVYNPKENTISVFPYHFKTNDIKLFRQAIIGAIRHEVTHAIDPKFYRKTYPPSTSYLDFDYEFDGISAQIIQRIQDKINNQNRNELMKWMKSSISPLPEYLYPFEKTIIYWKNNKPAWFRKLIQRIYNEVLSVYKI